MGINMAHWAPALLTALHAPVTHANVAALVGWQNAEGGAVHNNPFNTTEDAPGATEFNHLSGGGSVKSYTDPQEALHATVETLNNGLYNPVLQALRSSNPNAFVQAVGSSQWGTSGSTLASTVHDALGTNYGLTPADKKGSGTVAVAKGKVGKPKTTSTTVSDPGVTSTIETGGTADMKSAMLAALLAQPQDPSTSLVDKFMSNVSSGAYTTPVTTTTSKSGSISSTMKSTAAAKATGGSTGGGSKPAPGQHLDTKGRVVNAQGVPINPNGTGLGRTDVGVVTPKAAWNPSGKPVAEWIVPILQYAYNHGWRGTVNSGYRSDAEQTAIYNSGVRPAAVPKSEGGSGSNHEGNAFPAGAVDVAGASELSAILEKSPYAGALVYAGAKDPVHFSHPHDGGY